MPKPLQSLPRDGISEKDPTVSRAVNVTEGQVAEELDPKLIGVSDGQD
ncbi:MAG TPA: hypothetical protein VKH45_05350 [Candidatus Acidoferrum sp.]|nr:hypothetical protein [Candidatus Acidoferrum sp.]